MKKIILLILGMFLLAKNVNLPKSVFFSSHSWVYYRDKNVEKQNFDYSCGSASLATILHNFYKINVDERDILDYFLKIKKNDEVSFWDLSNVAKKFGFKSIGVKIEDINTLMKLKIPAIVYLTLDGFKHFSVLKKITNYKVYLADPTFGNITLPIDYFKEIIFKKEKSGFLLIILPQKSHNINWKFLNKKPLNINQKFFEIRNKSFLYKKVFETN